MIALAEELSGDAAGLGMLLQPAAVGLYLELFLWRDLNRQPLTEIHFSGAELPHGAHELPEVQLPPPPGSGDE